MAHQEIKNKNIEPQKFEDWLKNFIEKIHPYLTKLWEVRKKLLILNGLVASLVLIYLFLIAKPYYASTITILSEYDSKSKS